MVTRVECMPRACDLNHELQRKSNYTGLSIDRLEIQARFPDFSVSLTNQYFQMKIMIGSIKEIRILKIINQ